MLWTLYDASFLHHSTYIYNTMYQLIFEELRYDFEQKILSKGQKIKEECYNNTRKTLDGARQFAECMTLEKKNLLTE